MSFATSQDTSCYTAIMSPPIISFFSGHKIYVRVFKLFKKGCSFLIDHSTLNGLIDAILTVFSIDLTVN